MQRQIPISELSKEQLQILYDRMEQELEHLRSSLRTLHTAVSRLQRSLQCLDSLSHKEKGSPVMVPLTSSLYVPGSLADTKTVLVDIGTGYYVKSSLDKAEDYLKRRLKTVKTEVEKLQQLVSTKQEQYEYVSVALREKLIQTTG
jgi:prefoldin alpha subunit